MAIITLGSTVVGIRGSIGGVTYSSNKAGPHAKILSRGPNPRTAKQATARAALQQLGYAWRNLTDGERTGWNALSAAPPEVVTNSLGQTIVLSGFQWFSKIRLRQVAIGATQTTAAPVGAAPAASGVFTSTVATYNSVIQHDVGYFAANEYLVLLTTFKPGSAAATAYSGFRLTFWDLTPDAQFDTTWTGMLATWGTPILKSTCFSLFHKQLQNGLRSPVKTHSTVVI